LISFILAIVFVQNTFSWWIFGSSSSDDPVQQPTNAKIMSLRFFNRFEDALFDAGYSDNVSQCIRTQLEKSYAINIKTSHTLTYERLLLDVVARDQVEGIIGCWDLFFPEKQWYHYLKALHIFFGFIATLLLISAYQIFANEWARVRCNRDKLPTAGNDAIDVELDVQIDVPEEESEIEE